MVFRGYQFAIRWIASNDEPLLSDEVQVSEQVAVMLVADLFTLSPLSVARDVLRVRKEMESG